MTLFELLLLFSRQSEVIYSGSNCTLSLAWYFNNEWANSLNINGIFIFFKFKALDKVSLIKFTCEQEFKIALAIWYFSPELQIKIKVYKGSEMCHVLQLNCSKFFLHHVAYAKANDDVAYKNGRNIQRDILCIRNMSKDSWATN